MKTASMCYAYASYLTPSRVHKSCPTTVRREGASVCDVMGAGVVGVDAGVDAIEATRQKSFLLE